MLHNAYLFAKIGADTAENERNFAENLTKFVNYPTGPLLRRGAALRQGRRSRPAPVAAALGIWEVGQRCEPGRLRYSEGAGKLYKARSRPYRSQILQVNMRLKALAEIY